MSKTILLADDSVTIQKVVELTFMDGDYDVVAVSDGDDALERLEARLPDLVIADVHMPGADGYQVCSRVKEIDPSVPVLLLVGTFEPFDPDDMEASGADAHLKKPFDSQELLRLVEDLAQRGGSGPAAVAAGEEREEDTGELVAQAAGGEEDGGEDELALAAVDAGPLESASPEDDLGDEPPAGGAELDELGVEAAGDDAELSPWAEFERRLGAGDEAGQVPAADVEPADAQEEAPREATAEGRGREAGAEAAGDTPPEPPAVARPAGPSGEAGPSGGTGLSEEDVERVARRVVELLHEDGGLGQLGERIVREVSWEVVPDLAEVVIKGRLRELERELEDHEESGGAVTD